MTNQLDDAFGVRTKLTCKAGEVTVMSLAGLEEQGWNLSRLPFSIKVLLEAALRLKPAAHGGDAAETIAKWGVETAGRKEIPFLPSRVVMQDFTGVPALVDLAALRWAMQDLGGAASKVNPQVPVDLVIDHSVQVDHFGSQASLQHNVTKEFIRNQERYKFLHWGQQAFDQFRVVPPSMGIVHQINAEYLASVVQIERTGAIPIVKPDSLVGTDSHTTMINGLGVVGWGVGGIEAEAVMLGQPIYMLLPEVVGCELKGHLPEGSTATDLVLSLTHLLRSKGVVGKFVEFFGDGIASLSVADRITLSNMAPEYGATMGYFPVDRKTLAYLRLTARDEDHIDLVERYTKHQGLFLSADSPVCEYSDTLRLDMSQVGPTLAGPKRPHDKVTLFDMKSRWRKSLSAKVGPSGFGLPVERLAESVELTGPDISFALRHGHVVIAAITSCTNTSNPQVLIAAGLLAKKAVEKGLSVKPWVKTSFAPGSRVVMRYLASCGLLPYLEALRFHTVGYGCTTCIGNSGPLPEPIHSAVTEGELIVASVLSGNRNFEGRINPDTRANYLASPPLVIAYALAGSVDTDLTKEPVGYDANGEPVYLVDIWPTSDEILQLVNQHVRAEDFHQEYKTVFDANPRWNELGSEAMALYPWDEKSTYVRKPPFFEGISKEPQPVKPITDAYILALLPDSTTTDHISPAGTIASDSPAAVYLRENGVTQTDFNSYGSRRGNHEVMMRGTFANIRIRNGMLDGVEGGYTLHVPTGKQMTIWDASCRYREDGHDLLILAGKEYGTGSSRDWAAKGTGLLGVRAVIAESFERIHRSNLVGMGVLPLEFMNGDSVQKLSLTGKEQYTIEGVSDEMEPGKRLVVKVTGDQTKTKTFQVRCRVDTPVEMTYYRNGGILQTVLRSML